MASKNRTTKAQGKSLMSKTSHGTANTKRTTNKIPTVFPYTAVAKKKMLRVTECEAPRRGLEAGNTKQL
jgi:hypothetical protein